MPSRSILRASDTDRERVAERLRQATTEGRLLTEELEQRMEAALSARTYGQLDALIADLPGSGRPRRRSHRGLAVVPTALTLALALLAMLAIIAAVVLAISGVVAAWWLWAVAGWWFFGRRRCRRYGRYVRGYMPGAPTARSHRPGLN